MSRAGEQLNAAKRGSTARVAKWLALAAGVLILGCACPRLRAQAGPDTLVLTSGEKLTGHLESATASAVKFKSDGLGELTVTWSKIQELHSTARFAVIGKNVQLRKNADVSGIPQGTVAMTGQKVEVTPPSGASQTVPVSDVADLVESAAFQGAVTRNPGFFQDWTGTVTAGSSLIEATQRSVSFNTAISLARAIPSQTWLEPRNRTAVGFSAAYGKLSQPGAATIKTSIYSAVAQRDEYFTSQLYGVGKATFDHNFSQGLALQQIYAGGIGWTAIRSAAETLDLQATVDYERQSFQVAAQNENLIGSILAEIFNRKLAHQITLAQQAAIYPTWSNTRAFSANASAQLTFPVYKRFGFTTGVIDAYLNNPPPGFKKNSFQFTAGLTYTLP
jgi:Protein of unknown function, DUF481